MPRKVELREVMIESGPPGFSGKVGWLSVHAKQVFVGPRLKPGEEQVGPTTSFDTFTDAWRCTLRPLKSGNQKESKSARQRDAIDTSDGHGAWRT
jgi:hypothetical protein